MQEGHFALSCPTEPMIKILPIVLHSGHMPVVTFFGPVLIIFCVFLRVIKKMDELGIFKFTCKKRGEGDSNPRVLANMELAIPRPTRLGDPRLLVANLIWLISIT